MFRWAGQAFSWALLCLAILHAWGWISAARDADHVRMIQYESERSWGCSLTTSAKELRFCFYGATFATAQGWKYSRFEFSPPTFPKTWLGFGWYDMSAQSRSYPIRWIVIPHWGAATLLWIVPALSMFAMFRRWLRRRALARAGKCRGCGYDLRATPEPNGLLVDRCPECGLGPRIRTNPAAKSACPID